jgi:ABC-2 type transport system permease protein
MRFSKAWIVASKDFKTFRHRKAIIYSMVGFEVFASIGLPLIIKYAGESGPAGMPPAIFASILTAFGFFFAIGAAILPMAIATYSFIGEKLQKSLEPLLATPTTDSEIIIGKGLATFIPTIISTWIGGAIFMVFMNKVTAQKFGHTYFPNPEMWMILFVLAPLICILAIEINVLISAKFNDIRTAQQVGSLMVLPFMAIYVLSEVGVYTLNTTNLWIISGIIFVLAVVLYFLSVATFQREEILTKWK